MHYSLISADGRKGCALLYTGKFTTESIWKSPKNRELLVRKLVFLGKIRSAPSTDRIFYLLLYECKSETFNFLALKGINQEPQFRFRHIMGRKAIGPV